MNKMNKKIAVILVLTFGHLANSSFIASEDTIRASVTGARTANLTKRQQTQTDEVKAKLRGKGSSEGAMQGANLRRTGVYPTKGIQQVNSLVWKSDRMFEMPYLATKRWFNGQGFSEYFAGTYFDFSDPILADGMLYLELYVGDGHLVALDSHTGQLRWKFKASKSSLSAPAIANGMVYVGSRDAKLYALDAKTGEERWKFSHKDQGFSGSSPAVADGVIYFGSISGNLYAVDAETGQAKWICKINGSLTPAAIANDSIYIGNDKGNLYSINVETGQERWNFKARGLLGTPVVDEGTVYFRTGDGDLYAVDARTGRQKWASQIGGPVQMVFPLTSVKVGTPLALRDKTIYFGGKDNLYAVDAETGQEKWKFPLKNPCRSPIIADGVIYFGSIEALSAVDANTGRERWKLTATKAVCSSPAIADGIVYFVTDNGYFQAVH